MLVLLLVTFWAVSFPIYKNDDEEVDGDMYEHFGQYLPPIGWEGQLSPRS